MKAQTGNIGSLVIGILIPGILAAAHSPRAMGQAAPQWKVGDSWQVGAWHAQVYRPEERAQMGDYKLKGRMISVAFEVTGIKTVGQAACYEVNVTFPKEETGFQRHYEVFYAKDSGKLIRVRDISLLPDETTKDLTTDLQADAQGPVFLDSVPGAVPLEWPDLARQNIAPQAAPAGTVSQATVPGSVSSGGTASEDEVTLTKSTAKKEAKVVQRWRKGEPWWRVARKYDGGQLVEEAILLEVNGRTIANMPAEGQ